MFEFNSDTRNLKYQVLLEVAAMAFTGQLEEKVEEIPYKIINTDVPHFRCCVYKEREIIRERTRVAMGQEPTPGCHSNNLVKVLPAACEGCPISRFHVTDNCQKCLARKCEKACPFGAITMTGRGAYIDPAKCKECGRCASACPYNAIADLIRPCKRSCPTGAISIGENHVATILEDRCIRCGACVAACPFGAIADTSWMLDVIEALRNPKKKVFAVVAPAVEGQFGTAIGFGGIRRALCDIGFDDVWEAALGADAVTTHEAAELKMNMEIGNKMTSSCCPAFVSMIQKHFPNISDKISSTVSPMVATARYVKHRHPGCTVVFIGPCIAKKSEVFENPVEDSADLALTFEEMLAMLEAKGIDIQSYKDKDQQASVYGKGFAQAGGLTGAITKAFQEQNYPVMPTVRQCPGAEECKKALTLLNLGKLPEDFIEGMMCLQGCVSGPSGILPSKDVIRNRQKLYADLDRKDISQNLQDHDFTGISLER